MKPPKHDQIKQNNGLIVILSIILIALNGPSMAQGAKSSDYLVFNDNDTIYGQVEYIDERGAGREFYKKIRLTKVNGKQKKYKRETIKAFRVNGANYESFWLTQPAQAALPVRLVNPQYNIDTEKGEQTFLRVISSGRLTWYELEWFEQGNSTLWSMALLKRESDSYLIRADRGILGLKKKVLYDYFSDCPLIQEGIQQKRIKTVKELVDSYKAGC